MAEAITAITTVQALNLVLWDFAKLLDRYRHLPDRLYDLAENLEACELTLEWWRKRWGVLPNRSGEYHSVYFEVLWGKKGWVYIQRCIEAVATSVEALKVKTDKLVGTAMKYRRSARPELQAQNFKSDLVRQTIADIKGCMPIGRRFAWAVMYKMDDLDREIDRLNAKLTTLDRFSNYYLDLAHPELMNEDPNRRHSHARRLMEDQQREQLIKSAKKTRYDLTMLWDFCQDMQDTKVHLAIAGLQGDKASRSNHSSSRKVRMLVENGTQSSEWNITRQHSDSPNRRDSALELSRMDQTLHSAVRNATHAQLVPPNDRSGDIYSLRRTNRSVLQNLVREKPLDSIYQQERGIAAPRVSSRHVTAIAAALADGSFRILGTPWLSYLDAANIRGSLEANNTWLAMLVPGTGNAALNKALRDLQSLHPRYKLRQHSQLFRLGVVMVELALRCRVTYAEASKDKKEPGVAITLPEISEDEALYPAEVAAEVEMTVGETYANVVQFCLLALSDREMLKLEDLDRHFLPKSLEPAQKMLAMSESEDTTH